MTARVVHLLGCDGGGCEVEWMQPIPARNATELRAYLKTCGWARQRGRDLCPDCAAGRPSPHPTPVGVASS